MGLGDADIRSVDDEGSADSRQHGTLRGGDERRPGADPLARPRRRARGRPLCHDGLNGDGLEPRPRRADRDGPLSVLPDDAWSDPRSRHRLAPGDPCDRDPGPATRRRERRGLLRRPALSRRHPPALCRRPARTPTAPAGRPSPWARLARQADAHRDRPTLPLGPGHTRGSRPHGCHRHRRRGQRRDRRRRLGDDCWLHLGLPRHERSGPGPTRRAPRMVGAPPAPRSDPRLDRDGRRRDDGALDGPRSLVGPRPPSRRARGLDRAAARVLWAWREGWIESLLDRRT